MVEKLISLENDETFVKKMPPLRGINLSDVVSIVPEVQSSEINRVLENSMTLDHIF